MEFIRSVMADAVHASLRRDLWIPAVSISLVADAIVAAFDWPFGPGLPPAPERTITVMVLVILGKAWLSLTLCKVALALLRGQMAGLLNQWVPVTSALRIGSVSLVLLAPILLGTICLMLPGLYLLARWSQVVLILVDERATWFDAVEMSGALTAGYRWHILLILTGVSVLTLLGARMSDLFTPLAWAWRAAASTFGAALAAAMYRQLDLRAPWNPESEDFG